MLIIYLVFNEMTRDYANYTFNGTSYASYPFNETNCANYAFIERKLGKMYGKPRSVWFFNWLFIDDFIFCDLS